MWTEATAAILFAPRPGHRAVADDVGARDVDDVGIELGEVAPDPRRQCDRQPIFGAPGIGTDGMLTRSPVGGKAGLVDRRRIDAHLDALAQQIADEAVERLVGAVADIIVIARKQGDAEVARLHGAGL